MPEVFNMNNLQNIWQQRTVAEFDSAVILIQIRNGECIVTDVKDGSPSLILKCIIKINDDSFDVKHFLSRHNTTYPLDGTHYIHVDAIMSSYEPTTQTLMMHIDNKHCVYIQKDEKDCKFSGEAINEKPPPRPKKRRLGAITETEQHDIQHTNKKVKLDSLHVDSTPSIANIQNNHIKYTEQITPSTKRPPLMLMNQDENVKMMIPDTPTTPAGSSYNNSVNACILHTKRPPLTPINRDENVKMMIPDTPTTPAGSSYNNSVNTSILYSDEEDDDFDLFAAEYTATPKSKIDSRVMDIDTRSRLLIKDVANAHNPHKEFVEKYYCVAVLMAAKNIFIFDAYKGFKLVWRGQDDALITMTVWDKQSNAAKQYKSNELYIFWKFIMNEKKDKDIKYMPDNSLYTLKAHSGTRIIPLEETPEKYGIHKQYQFAYQKLINDKGHGKEIKFHHIFKNIKRNPALLKYLDATMHKQKDGTIKGSGINIMGLVVDKDVKQTHNKTQLHLVVQYKSNAIHVVVWDFNEPQKIIVKQTVIAVINGVIQVHPRRSDGTLQITVGDCSLLIIDPYHPLLSGKIETFRKMVMRYFTLSDVGQISKYNGTFEAKSLQEIGDATGRQSVQQNLYYQCIDVVKVYGIDFGVGNCPFSLYYRRKNKEYQYCHPSDVEADYALDPSNNYNKVPLTQVRINWNIHLLVKDVKLISSCIVRGKATDEIIKKFHQKQDPKEKYRQWHADKSHFICQLESLFKEVRLCSLKVAIEKKTKGPGFFVKFINANRQYN